MAKKRTPGPATQLRRALRERDEALEFQAATAAILASLSASSADAQPVFDAIVKNLLRLFGTRFATVHLLRGNEVHLAALRGTRGYEWLRGTYPQRLSDWNMTGRAILSGKVLQLTPCIGNPKAPPRTAEVAAKVGFNSIIAAPMIRGGKVLGSITTARRDAIAFGDREVALIRAFADQAAIAIENARLFNETKEALERQTATSQVLGVISSSPSDLTPVYRIILDNVLRLCEANIAALFLYDGEFLRTAAHRNATPQFTKQLEALRVRPSQETPTRRAALERRIVHVEDALNDPSFSLSEAHRREGAKTILSVPLLREDALVGVITIWRREKRLFTDTEIALLKTFADQAVIAIENVRLFNETKEALERQTATADILRVIAESPTDVQPVFDTIVRNAAALCGSLFANVFRYDGERVHFVASSMTDPQARNLLAEAYPRRPDRAQVSGRTVLAKAVVRMDDALSDPDYDRRHALAGGWRRMLGVPLLREGSAIGAIVVAWPEPGPVPQSQAQLLLTFADQAVIAIENVRLFNETKESLEQQTAISEVLRVISSSPADVQPVLEAVAARAARICDATDARIFLVDRDRIRHAAGFGDAPAPEDVSFDRGSVVGRAVIDRVPMHIDDVKALSSDEFPISRKIQERIGHRTMLAVPLMRDGRALGAILLRRMEVRPFTDKQIALLKTFADQAVIAIENARLFNETRESLEQQTAISEVLRVISSSPADVQPVLDAVAERTARICAAKYVDILLVDGDRLRMRVAIGELGRPGIGETRPLDRTTVMGRAVIDGAPVQVEDLQDESSEAEFPLGRQMALEWGHRTTFAVPLRRENRSLGVIVLRRPEVRPFSEKQVALLKTFADQAAIAIENVRLFNETKEALEQQTAISEVLRVISNSPADVQPVLDAVAERAARICDAGDAQIFLREGDDMKHVARFGEIPIGIEIGDARRLSRGWVAGRAVLEARAIHIEDLLAVPREEYPVSQELRDRAGHRTLLCVPLMRERQALGAISLRRMEVRPFTDKQIALLQTFADQAAIAIENVRLFNETKEALEQQKASGEVLGAISASIADTGPVFGKILESCERLFEGHLVGITLVREDGQLDRAAYRGPHEEEIRKMFPVPLTRDSASGNAILDAKVIHYPDIEAPGVPAGAVNRFRMVGVRAIICAPMLFEGRGVGAIWAGRSFVAPFSEKQVALLKTFADQAAIAIQNARLFREIQEKSAQLEVANKHKSDFLANMSHELRTPLNAVIGFSEALSERMFGELNDKQAEYLKDIHESGKHLLSLINDILDLSKIEAGRMELEVSSFHLPSALANAMTLVRERAQRHAIELELEVDERLGDYQGDERKFKQIMLNLLSNAVKFTPDGGRVDVSARMNTTSVEIAVKDTGIGIAPQDQAVVFEEFRQVGRDRMRKAEGTGLGLALTKRFVELHGGAIRLESTPGRGSTFSFTLPLRT